MESSGRMRFASWVVFSCDLFLRPHQGGAVLSCPPANTRMTLLILPWSYLTVLIPFDIYALLLLLLQLLSGSVEADPVPCHRWQPTGPAVPGVL